MASVEEWLNRLNGPIDRYRKSSDQLRKTADAKDRVLLQSRRDEAKAELARLGKHMVAAANEDGDSVAAELLEIIRSSLE